MRIKQKRERPGRPYKACTVASNCAQKRTHTEAKTTGPPPRAAPPADSIRGLLAAANEATGTKPFALGATDTPFYRRDGGKGRWLKREDEQLRAILAKVKDMGSADWEKIARKHATRDAGECRLRWEKVIKIGGKMGRFTAEEDQKILDLVKEGLDRVEIIFQAPHAL